MDREKVKQIIVSPLIFFGVFYGTWILRTGSFRVSFSDVKPPIRTPPPGAKASPQAGAKASPPPGAQVKSARATPLARSPTTPKPVETMQGKVSFREPPQVPVIKTWGRDPFLAPKEVESPKLAAAPQDLKITSIIINGPRRVATIGDTVVREGEMVGNEKVVEIREDGVILSRGEDRRFLELQISGSP